MGAKVHVQEFLEVGSAHQVRMLSEELRLTRAGSLQVVPLNYATDSKFAQGSR